MKRLIFRNLSVGGLKVIFEPDYVEYELSEGQDLIVFNPGDYDAMVTLENECLGVWCDDDHKIVIIDSEDDDSSKRFR